MDPRLERPAAFRCLENQLLKCKCDLGILNGLSTERRPLYLGFFDHSLRQLVSCLFYFSLGIDLGAV